MKKVFLKTSQKTLVLSFKRGSNTVFSREYSGIFKNTYFEKYLRTAASLCRVSVFSSHFSSQHIAENLRKLNHNVSPNYSTTIVLERKFLFFVTLKTLPESSQ